MRKMITLAVAMAAAAMSLAGCGGTIGAEPSATAEETETAAPTTAQFVPATSGKVTIYTWADYYPVEELERFKQETGIDYSIDFFDSNETLVAKLEASGNTGYDVVVPSDYTVEQMIAKGMLLEFDAMSLPNAENIDESTRDPYFDPGRKYSAPFAYGTTAFAYDTSLLAAGQQGPQTWKEFFAWEGEPYEGHIGVLADVYETIVPAMRAQGAPDCTDDPAYLQGAQDLLMGLKPKINTISSDAVADRLATGENRMAIIWNGDTHRAWEVNDAIEYIYPEEGVSIWSDNWVIPAGAENVDQAKTFINWMLDPKNSAEAAEYVGFNTLIKGAFEYLPESMQQDPAIVPPEGTKIVEFRSCSNDIVNKYNQIWETFKQ
ncbi:MAG: spermidine/putrescine ABC transporter substrate-binding protein [Propionibacteriaceae bacterium]|jgi:spermidine/putrescine transport system substrate-binding protein|nr:spermidine/putrescine ABC transporter substrate-binding protein [Propionibacteriaceae bacterium]